MHVMGFMAVNALTTVYEGHSLHHFKSMKYQQVSTWQAAVINLNTFNAHIYSYTSQYSVLFTERRKPYIHAYGWHALR